MKMHADAKCAINELLKEQKTGVLATCNKDIPHTSVVGFAVSENLKSIYFATPIATIKYSILKQNPNVELLVDNRKNLAEDFNTAAAVSCVGKASCIDKDNSGAQHIMLQRHPELETFFKSPTCAIIEIKISKYSLVTRFQDVTEIEISQQTSK